MSPGGLSICRKCLRAKHLVSSEHADNYRMDLAETGIAAMRCSLGIRACAGAIMAPITIFLDVQYIPPSSGLGDA